MSADILVAGWSRTRIRLAPSALVLDVGSGAFPNRRADILCDWSLWHDRGGKRPVVDRPFVVADASALPFKTQSIDFVIATHIAEHVHDPNPLCSELARVARAGYIETPTPAFDRLFHEPGHLWRVDCSRGTLRFRRMPSRGRIELAVTQALYKIYYAGEHHQRPTLRLPNGLVGRLFQLVQYGLRGFLNRSGLIHTRYHFSPRCPLRYSVDAASSARTSSASPAGDPNRA